MAVKKVTEAEAANTTASAGKDTTVYSVKEYAAASYEIFGKSPDIVVAAFRVNNLKEATISEAKDIVRKFANKEV